MLILTAMTNEQGGRNDRKELEKLLLQTASGDKEAFAEIYRRTKAAVYGLALSYLRRPDDAGDVTHDTFIKVWDNAPSYTPKGSPMGWLLTIARNLSLMKLRSESRLETPDNEEWDAIPDDREVSSDDRIMLQHALGKLGDEERKIVILHSVTGLKHREIAELLELPLATVLSKYNRALKKLKIILKGEEKQ